jgi:hypothetical protein
MAITTSAARPYGEVPGRDFLDVDLTAAGRKACGEALREADTQDST